MKTLLACRMVLVVVTLASFLGCGKKVTDKQDDTTVTSHHGKKKQKNLARSAGLRPALDSVGDSGQTSFEASVEGFREAAERGDAAAQIELGYVYCNGNEGVPPNYAEALKWFRKAAEQGDAKGLLMLGSMYRLGNGVEQDNVEAYKWYSLSEVAGFAPAAEARDGAAKSLTPEQIAEGKRRAAEFKSPKQ